MKKQTLVAGLAVAALGLGTTAWAGTKVAVTVFIDTSTRYAGGGLGAARASADHMQYIGVETGTYVGGDFVTVFARDISGTYVSCRSTTPSMIATARSLNNDSFIYFEWDTSGTCTTLNVITSSHHAPKTP